MNTVSRLISRLAVSAAVTTAIGLALTGCSDDKFKVQGTVSQADNRILLLEKIDSRGQWITVDSASTDSKGNFSIKFLRPDYPQIYRLALGDKYIYFPIDSTEHLTVTSSAAAFGSDFTLSGSPAAEKLMAFEKEAQRIERLANPDSTAAFRRKVFDKYLHADKASTLGYYILSRPWGNSEYLIDYTDPIYSAVANQFQTYRPDDPRTTALVQRAKEGQAQRRRQAGQARVIQAQETGMIDITLHDKNGQLTALSSLLGKGRPVILAFSTMTQPSDPAVNRLLKEIYDASLADIYQVCVDADQLAWKTAARPLPWTVVYDPQGASSHNLLNYNVTSLPKFYIYDTRGELHRESTSDPASLRRILSSVN